MRSPPGVSSNGNIFVTYTPKSSRNAFVCPTFFFFFASVQSIIGLPGRNPDGRPGYERGRELSKLPRGMRVRLSICCFTRQDLTTTTSRSDV